jgi:hypothetical protein
MRHMPPIIRLFPRLLATWFLATWFLATWFLAACAGQAQTHRAIDVAAFRDATRRSFAHADFLKPTNAGVSERLVELAPLIAQQRSDVADVTDGHRDRFGAVEFASDGTHRVDRAAPTVYADQTWTRIAGTDREQLVYLWFYPDQSGDASSLQAQGVRITIDAQNRPAIWEPLADTRSIHPLYIAGSLESAAQSRFGAPASDRVYHAEAPRSAAPDAFVARVLSDGPVPMGPWVYLERGSRNVATLLCRCSPSQTDEFVETLYYELRPLSEVIGLEPPAGTPSAIADMLQGDIGRDPSDRLRLPADF